LSENQHPQDPENESSDNPERHARNMQSEFMGGATDFDDEEIVDGDELKRTPNPFAKMDLQTVKTILQREEEIEAANKPSLCAIERTESLHKTHVFDG
jgi:hypothetical protein